MTDLIREVEEDLRRENLEKLWRKYGIYALVAAILVVVGVAANVGWQSYTTSVRDERARQYESALTLLAAADPKAGEAFHSLAKGSDGYAALSRLHEAALKANVGDVAGATAIYEALADDGDVDQPIRELAVILIALHTADSAEPAQLTERLKPLTGAESTWRYSALEITALLAQRAGDTEKAKQILTGLADDLNAPRALRQRATEMLAALKE